MIKYKGILRNFFYRKTWKPQLLNLDTRIRFMWPSKPFWPFDDYYKTYGGLYRSFRFLVFPIIQGHYDPAKSESRSHLTILRFYNVK